MRFLGGYFMLIVCLSFVLKGKAGDPVVCSLLIIIRNRRQTDKSKKTQTFRYVNTHAYTHTHKDFICGSLTHALKILTHANRSTQSTAVCK